MSERACGAKRMFRTHVVAQTVADFESTPEMRLHVYRCGACQHYHLTKNGDGPDVVRPESEVMPGETP